MTTKEKVIAIIQNKEFIEYCADLRDRWLDEREYEDITEYGKVIVSSINKVYPDYHAEYKASTMKPFGFKFAIDGLIWHLFVSPISSHKYRVAAKLLK